MSVIATRGSGGLEFLLSDAATAAECTSVDACWPSHMALCAQHANPIEAAIAGGFASDRLAWAFCSGYQAALRALLAVASSARVQRLARAWQRSDEEHRV